jgi:hypothetical protein
MDRALFVAWLFIMAGACVLAAIGDQSFGWLIGGIVLFSIAIYARRQFKKEWVEGHAGPRFGFVAMAMLIMVIAIYLLTRQSKTRFICIANVGMFEIRDYAFWGLD